MEDKSDSPEHVIDIDDIALRNNGPTIRRRKSSPKMSESNEYEVCYKKKLAGKISVENLLFAQNIWKIMVHTCCNIATRNFKTYNNSRSDPY